jgi:hypothetical protein
LRTAAAPPGSGGEVHGLGLRRGQVSKWTTYAGDSDLFDPDAVRIGLATSTVTTFSPDTDVRLPIQLADNRGSGGWGAVQATPWASQGGGWSGWAADSDSFDPDVVRICIETRPMPGFRRRTSASAYSSPTDAARTALVRSIMSNRLRAAAEGSSGDHGKAVQSACFISQATRRWASARRYVPKAPSANGRSASRAADWRPSLIRQSARLKRASGSKVERGKSRR